MDSYQESVEMDSYLLGDLFRCRCLTILEPERGHRLVIDWEADPSRPSGGVHEGWMFHPTS